jgi:hypothetical protein
MGAISIRGMTQENGRSKTDLLSVARRHERHWRHAMLTWLP